MILDQHQIYLLILGGQIRGKWSLKYRGAQIWNILKHTSHLRKKQYCLCAKSNISNLLR